MKISCDQATTICDKSQYGEVTFWEKIKLSIHLLLCKTCGKYTKQNGVMTKCYKKQAEFEEKTKCCLSEDEKQCMEKDIKEKI